MHKFSYHHWGPCPRPLSHTHKGNEPIVYEVAARGRRLGRCLPSDETAGMRPIEVSGEVLNQLMSLP
jgi:hypothetical protein